jgi:hypothetical protein
LTVPRRASNLRCSAGNALVAQLDRASDYGSEGWEFESLRAHEGKLEAGGWRLEAGGWRLEAGNLKPSALSL